MDIEKQNYITDELNTWAEYFRKKITPRIQKEYLDIIENYSMETIKAVMRSVLHQRDFFPKLYEIVPLFNEQETLPTNYNSDEDFNFPLDKMFTAYGILWRHGPDRFVNYCNRVGMPGNDRERVVAKYEIDLRRKQKTKRLPDPDVIDAEILPVVDQIGIDVKSEI